MTEDMTIQADLTKVTVVVESVLNSTSHVYGSKPEVLHQEEYGWHEEYLEKMCGQEFKERHRTRNKGETSGVVLCSSSHRLFRF